MSEKSKPYTQEEWHAALELVRRGTGGLLVQAQVLRGVDRSLRKINDNGLWNRLGFKKCSQINANRAKIAGSVMGYASNCADALVAIKNQEKNFPGSVEKFIIGPVGEVIEKGFQNGGAQEAARRVLEFLGVDIFPKEDPPKEEQVQV